MGTSWDGRTEVRSEDGTWHEAEDWILREGDPNAKEDWLRRPWSLWDQVDYETYAVLAGARMYGHVKPVTTEIVRINPDVNSSADPFAEGEEPQGFWFDSRPEPEYGYIVTLADLLGYDWDQPFWRSAWVRAEHLDKLLEQGGPALSLCAHRFSEGSRIPENAIPLSFRSTPRIEAAWFVNHVVPYLQTLGAPENVRLVFKFSW